MNLPDMTIKQYQCSRGHRYEARAPLAFNWTAGDGVGQVTLSTGPLCGLCLIQWISLTFPTQQVGHVVEVDPGDMS